MPSVSDITRNITINSKAVGVDQTNAALGSLQDALGATAGAAKSSFDAVSQAASGVSGGGLFGIAGLAPGVGAGTAAIIGLLARFSDGSVFSDGGVIAQLPPNKRNG
jgi:hypothetical protein